MIVTRLWLAGLIVTVAATASAADAPPCASADTGRLDVLLENDTQTIDLLHQSDDEYTNGVMAAWNHTIPEGEGPLHTLWPFKARPDRCFNYGFTLGQSLYTPRNLLTPDRILTDRPYAAWLYVAYAIQSVKLDSEPPDRRGVKTTETFVVNVGVIGPAAFGEQAQNTAHRLFNVRVRPGGPIKIAQGWGNQLSNEPGVYGEYRREDKRVQAFAGTHRVFDLVTSWRAVAGNVFTFAGAGGRIRFGKDLQDGIVGRPTTIALAFDGSARPNPFSLGKLIPSEFYFFVGDEARLVLRNEFLDGTFFRDSAQSVQKEPAVNDVEFGAAVRYGWFKLTYRTVVRTSEYRLHPGNHYFGSIAATFGN